VRGSGFRSSLRLWGTVSCGQHQRAGARSLVASASTAAMPSQCPHHTSHRFNSEHDGLVYGFVSRLAQAPDASSQPPAGPASDAGCSNLLRSRRCRPHAHLPPSAGPGCRCGRPLWLQCRVRSLVGPAPPCTRKPPTFPATVGFARARDDLYAGDKHGTAREVWEATAGALSFFVLHIRRAPI
jgi:hypothetical protein